MIVTKLKPIEEIYEMVKGRTNILVVGCDGCCQPPRSIHEADTLGKLLKLKMQIDNKTFTYKPVTVLRQCDEKISANALRSLVNDYEAIISLSCGIGVQTLTKIFPEKITYPAQNTMFNGNADYEMNAYVDKCKQCGDCILDLTGGICPVSGCAKSLLNGPCGGQIKGKCEVKGYTVDCAWVLIYKRLKSLGRLDLFDEYRPKRDYRLMTSPKFQSFLELEDLEKPKENDKEGKTH